MEIVKFWLNNWSSEYYPEINPFIGKDGWVENFDRLDQTFLNNNWCIRNKIVVNYDLVDMSIDMAITAPKSWIEEHCKGLLGTKFVVKNNEKESYWGTPFLEYKPNNYGSRLVK